jgi:hypothetical protein
MIGKPMGFQEGGMFGGRTPKIGFVAALGLGVLAMIPMQARAQVNIDQGKSPADIFANDCAACHKSTRGLANGQNSLALSSFLREHYTASKEQANALAAYVLANGGGSGTPQKPVAVSEPKSSEPKSSEPKSSEPKSSDARSSEPKGIKSSEPKSSEAKPSDSRAAGAKPAVRPTRAAARGEEEASPNAKQQHPADEREVQPVTANRTTKPESEPTPPAQQPAIGAVPAPNEAPGTASAPRPEAPPTTSAAAPAEPQSGDGATVPRDDIPD